MNNAKLYSEFSSMPQSDSNLIAKEYLSVINERFDSILDIGCGPGDTLINKILPHFRQKWTFRRSGHFEKYGGTS